VIGRVTEAQGLYDKTNVAVWQMAIAIAGFRANEGAQGWQNPSDAQKKFKPFNLDSYQRGKLDFEIMPRPVLPPTALERSQERVQYWSALNAEKSFGVPEEVILEDEGWQPDRIALLTQAKQTDMQQAVAIAQASAPSGQDATPTTTAKPNPFQKN
jgi:hypothetical protein